MKLMNLDYKFEPLTLCSTKSEDDRHYDLYDWLTKCGLDFDDNFSWEIPKEGLVGLTDEDYALAKDFGIQEDFARTFVKELIDMGETDEDYPGWCFLSWIDPMCEDA